jgi:tetratricopeptide (TPR) repeat protein
MSSQELFDDGNRLFRDDLYWAALLRYQQAGEAGMNTALLHYNTGVAHYKAGQHIRARESLKKATRSSSLEPMAHFNLGLNAYAAGDPDESLRWFRLARDQQQNEKISNLAKKAIGRIRRQAIEEDPVYQRAEEERKEKSIFDFDFFVQAGFGNDTNVFRSPSAPYIDFADPALPLVTPVVQSGAFVPVDLGVKYMINSYTFEGFYGAYRMSGSYYQDRAQSDADEFSHEIRIGNEYYRNEDNRKTEVYSAFKISQHDETYYDPDDGLPRSVGGVDIGDRMSYKRYGPDIRVRRTYNKLSIGGVGKAYLYDFENVEAVPSYDHEYFLLGVHTQYKFTPTSLLRLTAERFSRRYYDRPSFELDGSQPIGNSPVRYDYVGLSLLARQRITRSMWFGFEYERVDREDRYLGYNNYVRDHYEVEFNWSPGARFDVEISGYYRNYLYEGAFAFNNPALPRKTLETSRIDAAISYRITPQLSVTLDARADDFVSNDTRIQYDRTRYSLGIMWRQ